MIQSTGNPAIQKVSQYLNPAGNGDWARDMAAPKVMTYQGAIINTAILLGITVGTAGLLWSFATEGYSWLMLIIGVVGYLGLALPVMFKPRLAPFLAPPLALALGSLVAGMSFMWITWFDPEQAAAKGGAMAQLNTTMIAQAAGLTFAITAAMLALYATRVIRATPIVVRMILVATVGVIFFGLANFLLGAFLGKPLVIWDGGPLSIAISAGVVLVAAFNLIIDFKIVEDGVANKAPKWMEWYAGFALLITIVWLYISILRLLAMLRGGE